MTKASAQKGRTEVARIINGSREAIYGAFLDPVALASWLPPGTMTAQVHSFDARVGGGYRLSLTYHESDGRPPGKTTDDTDTVRTRFVELVPHWRIVQLVEFESADPALAGQMRMTVALREAGEGSAVSILCEDIPPGIRPEDNEAGCRSSLEKLAAFIEQGTRS